MQQDKAILVKSLAYLQKHLRQISSEMCFENFEKEKMVKVFKFLCKQQYSQQY